MSGVHYEKRDIEAGGILRVGIVVFAVSTVAALILLPFLSHLQERAAQTDPPTAPLARYEPGRQPPQPRLQERPFADVASLHAEEAALLSSYGWVDREHGVVRVPVERAVELVLERGLPVRAGAGAGTDTGHTEQP